MWKKRAVRILGDAYKKYGPYVYAKEEKESFCCALFRSKNQDPTMGWIYPEKEIYLERSFNSEAAVSNLNTLG